MPLPPIHIKGIMCLWKERGKASCWSLWKERACLPECEKSLSYYHIPTLYSLGEKIAKRKADQAGTFVAIDANRWLQYPANRLVRFQGFWFEGSSFHEILLPRVIWHHLETLWMSHQQRDRAVLLAPKWVEAMPRQRSAQTPDLIVACSAEVGVTLFSRWV